MIQIKTLVRMAFGADALTKNKYGKFRYTKETKDGKTIVTFFEKENVHPFAIVTTENSEVYVVIKRTINKEQDFLDEVEWFYPKVNGAVKEYENESTKILKAPNQIQTPPRFYFDTKVIINWNGKFHRAIETEDFVYFVNYQEGDENACVKMYRKSDFSLASDNYFAYSDMFELITERFKEITYLSPMMKENVRLHNEAMAEN